MASTIPLGNQSADVTERKAETMKRGKKHLLKFTFISLFIKTTNFSPINRVSCSTEGIRHSRQSLATFFFLPIRICSPMEDDNTFSNDTAAPQSNSTGIPDFVKKLFR
jgi:hypothetical protein